MQIETVEDEIKTEEKSEETSKGLAPNNDNGYDFENYKWTQNAKDLSLYIPISENIKGKDIIVELNPTKILVGIRGSEPFFNGELFSVIKTDNCTWLINSDDKRELVVELDKKKFDEWWPCVMKGDPEIDLSLVRPPNANMSDLDQETRATINKMMFEQQEKEKQGFYKDRM
jgi:hypothetical protein